MATSEKHEVQIKIRAFPYYVKVADPVTGEPRTEERVARRGDVIELSDNDFARAERFGAILTDEERDATTAETPPAGDASVVPEDATAAELSEWIKSTKPTVDTVVERSDDDPAIAQKLIEAENLATGGQPRATLVSRLQDIIDAHAD